MNLQFIYNRGVKRNCAGRCRQPEERVARIARSGSNRQAGGEGEHQSSLDGARTGKLQLSFRVGGTLKQGGPVFGEDHASA
jgi:hypothetical protein